MSQLLRGHNNGYTFGDYRDMSNPNYWLQSPVNNSSLLIDISKSGNTIFANSLVAVNTAATRNMGFAGYKFIPRIYPENLQNSNLEIRFRVHGGNYTAAAGFTQSAIFGMAWSIGNDMSGCGTGAYLTSGARFQRFESYSQPWPSAYGLDTVAFAVGTEYYRMRFSPGSHRIYWEYWDGAAWNDILAATAPVEYDDYAVFQSGVKIVLGCFFSGMSPGLNSYISGFEVYKGQLRFS